MTLISYISQMKTVLICVFICIFSSQLSAADDWAIEEVLSQLSEMRKEINSLNAEVTTLREEVTRLKKEGISGGGYSDSLDISNAPSLGDESASIAIVEFTDFQCPYCQRHFKNTFPLIDKNYVKTGKIKYIAKQFPLDFHGRAKKASIAALCAQDQRKGLYWEMHKSLFSGLYSIHHQSFMQLAKKHQLDMEDFSSCLNNPLKSERIDKEIEEGRSVGVQGTPAFLIGKVENGKVVNGRLLSGARQYPRFASLIERVLQE